jgi:hypothetical protein
MEYRIVSKRLETVRSDTEHLEEFLDGSFGVIEQCSTVL